MTNLAVRRELADLRQTLDALNERLEDADSYQLAELLLFARDVNSRLNGITEQIEGVEESPTSPVDTSGAAVPTNGPL